MFVLAKRNIILPGPEGKQALRLRRGMVEFLPDWAAETDYFKALTADGKIVVSGTKDRDIQAAEEKKTRVRRGKETTEE